MAPIPGETKVWQYVSLMKRIYLIDCPGIVPPASTDTPTDLVLRGVARVEKVENPEQYIAPLMQRVKQHHLERTYEIKGWTNHIEFLELLARKGGRLLKGGEPDLDGVAKMVLNDFMRGKIPWFTPAPAPPGKEDDGGDVNNPAREGRLGEMPKKRKQVETADEDEISAEAQLQQEASFALEREDEDDEESGDEEFEGFGSDTEESRSRKPSFGMTVATESDGDSTPDDVLGGPNDEAEEQLSQALRSNKRRRT